LTNRPAEKFVKKQPKMLASNQWKKKVTSSFVACTVLCILAIWQFTESDAVWRAVATFIVVSVATGIFTFVNEKLG
jgi:MFS-type transporter involved in bile tolerance (Atg22 family)